MDSVKWRRIVLFVGIVFGANWGAAGIFALSGLSLGGLPGAVFAAAYMIVPAIVAIVLARRWGRGLRDYGLRLPRNWYLALAPLIPLLLSVLTVAVALLIGFGVFDPTGMAIIDRVQVMDEAAAAQTMRERAEEMPVSLPLVILFTAPLAGFTINGLFALGEELGWRGLLQQELAPLGFTRSAVLIGLIWGLWHAPMILLGHNFPENPRLGVLIMTIACVPLGIIMSWLALKSASVIAAAVAHGTFNAAGGLTLMVVRGGETIEVFALGYAGILAMTLVALVLLALRPRRAGYSAPPS